MLILLKRQARESLCTCNGVCKSGLGKEDVAYAVNYSSQSETASAAVSQVICFSYLKKQQLGVRC